jgi:hypothetical protein
MQKGLERRREVGLNDRECDATDKNKTPTSPSPSKDRSEETARMNQFAKHKSRDFATKKAKGHRI